MRNPRVTVGVPVRNGAATLAMALDSLFAQSFRDFTVIVSDNASTDATQALCAKYATRHDNMICKRHAEPCSVIANYRYVLDTARTEYFMWLAADDAIAEDFLARHVSYLEAHSDYVSSQSKVLFHRNHEPTRLAEGTYALRGTPAQNIRAFLSSPSDNCRFYGLYRTAALQSSFPDYDAINFDWALTARVLLQGKQNEIADVLMLRDETPAAAYREKFDATHPALLDRVIPPRQLINYLLRHHPEMRQPAIAGAMLKLSTRMSRDYFLERTYRAADKIRRKQAQPKGLLHGTAATVMALTDQDASEGLGTRLARQFLPQLQGRPSDELKPLKLRHKHWRSPGAVSAVAPDLAIVLIVENDVASTVRLIDAATTAAQGKRLEVILVDTGSRDVTPLLFAKRADITFHRCVTTASFAEVANLALTSARSETVIFMAQHITMFEKCLTNLHRGLQNADMAVATPANEASAKARHHQPAPLFAIRVDALRRHLRALPLVGAEVASAAAALTGAIIAVGGIVHQVSDALTRQTSD